MTTRHLEALFQSLTDEELISRAGAGTLSDEAVPLAHRELQRRGLGLPPPPPPPPPAADADHAEAPYLGDMVLLERGWSPTEAHLLVSCLHAAGIQAEASDTQIVQAHSLLSIAVGGASIRVPESQLTEARDVLVAFRRGDFTLGEDFDPGPAAA